MSGSRKAVGKTHAIEAWVPMRSSCEDIERFVVTYWLLGLIGTW